MIRPADELGSVLVGRSIARLFRERVEAMIEASDDVVVDFEGVEAVSPSFADELFAKLPADLVDAGRVRFENVDSGLDALARYVVTGREGQR